MRIQSITKLATIVGVLSAVSALVACGAAGPEEAIGTAQQTLPIDEADAWVNGWTGAGRGSNGYAHEGAGVTLATHWGTDSGQNGVFSSLADCSFFANTTLRRYYTSWTDSNFNSWLCNGSCPVGRPQAVHYHDRIQAGTHFTQITDVTQIAAGDIIAIAYYDNSGNTGHVMWADSGSTVICSTCTPKTYRVNVIDSSNNYHGTGDTRYIGGACTTDADCSGTTYASCSSATNKCSYTGIGRGTLRLYADSGNTLTGYSWSTASTSTAYMNSDSPLLRHIVVGRYDGYAGN